MHEWNRQQLWSGDNERRQRKPQRRAAALAAGLGFVVAAMSIAWIEYAYQRPAIHMDPVAPAECRVDADCVLVPDQLTCCGECEPAPPFTAVSRTVLDDLRRATEDECIPTTRLCDPPACAPLPAGCVARAVCEQGICTPRASTGCLYR